METAPTSGNSSMEKTGRAQTIHRQRVKTPCCTHTVVQENATHTENTVLYTSEPNLLAKEDNTFHNEVFC